MVVTLRILKILLEFLSFQKFNDESGKLKI